MSAKTVFISYRRDPTGRAFARSLKQELTHHGYDVFLDVDSIDAGKWEHQIRNQIPERSHFLLLLTPGALDRCEDANDWVRQEFELAVQSKRNIVPVREESVDLSELRSKCPESMKSLFDYQIATVESVGFDRDVESLIERYISPYKAPQFEDGGANCVVSPTRLHHGADHLFGREQELAALDQLANDPTKKVLTIVAWGGVGKTSLIIEWMARQAAKNWNGFERVFDWSFFSQGTKTTEEGGASAGTFIAAALRFFGDEAMADSAASPWDKGARLATLIAQRRSLLVLDGIEPLQYPPGPMTGELKDPALATLLKGLARHNQGLCIVTTRERVTDLSPFRDTTAPEWKLDRLPTEAGFDLLKTLGVRGTAAEFDKLIEDVKGHALTLNLIGRYLAKAHQGDIRKRDQVKFDKADAKIQGGYAFKTIGAYEKWLAEGGEDGAGALAVLRLLGLFDRPADAGCLRALRSEPAIEGLTEALVGLDDEDWNLAVSALEECGLVSRDGQLETPNSKLGTALDAHPLIREYFGKQLREKNPDGWRAAHRRLYEHLRDTTNEGEEPTLEDLQPLYQAVAHGCQARLQQEACDDVYRDRILRGAEHYSWVRLGSYSSELAAQACFFEVPWSRVSLLLKEPAQAWLLNEAAFCLGALGRLTEALEPMRAALESAVKKEGWRNAAASATILSDLEVTLGAVAKAEADAVKSVTYADCSDDWDWRRSSRVKLGDVLHQAGRPAEALAQFDNGESIQAEHQSNYPQLYSVEGFLYCDLLLTRAECEAWRAILQLETRNTERETAATSCRGVFKRAVQMIQWTEQNRLPLLASALVHLTLGCATLYQGILEHHDFRLPTSELSNIDAAVVGLRRASQSDYLPRGLLTRAWLRFLTSAHTGTESAQEDLDEAWEIAERGPMRLHMADIHLYRARLFHGVKPYPWNTNPDGSSREPKDDLAAARKLIEQCGYWRRKEELEDAEEAAKNW